MTKSQKVKVDCGQTWDIEIYGNWAQKQEGQLQLLLLNSLSLL
jgi:hypothetical protein